MLEKKTNYYDVIGIGNALIDVYSKVGELFLSERHLTKNQMTPLSPADMGLIHNDIIPIQETCGGSVANTLVGLSTLGATTAFIGKVHDDFWGKKFSRELGVSGVDFFTPMLKNGPMTGRSIILVTPDAKHSMFTYLGANLHLSISDIDENLIKDSLVTYIEGYLFASEKGAEIAAHAAQIAHKHKRKIAFLLPDITFSPQYKEQLQQFVSQNVDILFTSEQAIHNFYIGKSIDQCINLLNSFIPTIVVKKTLNDTIIIHNNQKIYSPAEKDNNVIDYSGNLDLFASGFLYGYTKNYSIEDCVNIASITSAEAITHYGSRPEISLRGLLRNTLTACNNQ